MNKVTKHRRAINRDRARTHVRTHQVELLPAEKAVVVRVELSERQLDLVQLFAALKERRRISS